MCFCQWTLRKFIQFSFDWGFIDFFFSLSLRQCCCKCKKCILLIKRVKVWSLRSMCKLSWKFGFHFLCGWKSVKKSSKISVLTRNLNKKSIPISFSSLRYYLLRVFIFLYRFAFIMIIFLLNERNLSCQSKRKSGSDSEKSVEESIAHITIFSSLFCSLHDKITATNCSKLNNIHGVFTWQICSFKWLEWSVRSRVTRTHTLPTLYFMLSSVLHRHQVLLHWNLIVKKVAELEWSMEMVIWSEWNVVKDIGSCVWVLINRANVWK